MRLLLDDSIPRRLKRAFGSGVLVETVPELRWAGIKITELAGGGLIATVTADRGIEYQQRLDVQPIAVIIMLAYWNRMADLQPLVPQVERRLDPSMGRRVYRVAV